MSDKTQMTGHCLCGAVEITAKNASLHVGACHCDMCRRWGGGPFLAFDGGLDVSFKGDEKIAVFKSSEWADRGFCKTCGSHLFYRLKEHQQYILPAGLFGDQAGFVFDHQVFIDEKPGFYQFSNDTKDMTGEELFAKFAPKAE